MIEVTNNIKARFPAAFHKARHERIRAVRLAPDLWYCARVAPGHGRYLVRFFVIPTVKGGEQIKVECRSVDGGTCKGSWRENLCVHAAFVIQRGIKYGRAKQRREAA